MKTSEILCCVNSDGVLKANILGVFAANRIPKRISSGGVIVNTDDDRKPGQHWVAIYYDGSGKGKFFDSYGRSPETYGAHFVSNILANSSSFIYNLVRLQNDISDVCGQFCLFYLMHRLRREEMKDIVKRFDNYPNNDYHVLQFISTIFSFCVTTSSSTFNVNQTCKPLCK